MNTKSRSYFVFVCYALCFTLIRFLILTDFALRYHTPSAKCLIYALCYSTIYANIRVIFFDVASRACGTSYVSTIGNKQTLITKCEQGFVSVNKVHGSLLSETHLQTNNCTKFNCCLR